MATTGSLRRYSLAIPQELFENLEQEAKQRDMTIVELLKTFIKIGLIVLKGEARGDTQFIIRQGDREREIWVLATSPNTDLDRPLDTSS